MSSPAIAAILKAAIRVQQSELLGTLPIQNALSSSVLQPHITDAASLASSGGVPAGPMCDAVLSALQQLPGSSSSSSMPMAAVAFLVMSVALEEGSRTTAAFSQGSRAGEAGKISAAEDSDMIEGKADEEEECGGRADDAILFQGMDNAQITDQLMVLLPEKEDKR